MSDFILGTDWSHWQGETGISNDIIEKFHDNGCRWLVNKATEGTHLVDASLRRNVQRVERRGWVAGAYHFLTGTDPEQQARHYIHTVREEIGGFEGRLAIVDVEAAPWTVSPKAWHVRRFVKEFKSRLPNHPIGIYTSEGYWRRIGNPDGASWADYLWQARWIDGDPLGNVTLPPRPPAAGFGGWEGRPKMWQWGRVWLRSQGETHYIDGNAYYGTLDHLKRKTGAPAKPLEARPKYREGHNDSIDRIISHVAVADGPVAGSEAYRAGWEAARESATEALKGAKLT